MKKDKVKSSKASINKKIRKEMETQLSTAFYAVASEFGKVKKANKIIEKFSKQLVKKISLQPKDDSLEGFVKEEEVLVITPEVKSTTKKAAGKKKSTAEVE